MREKERLDAIKQSVEEAQGRFSCGQMMDPFGEAAEYVGYLESAVMQTVALKSEMEEKLKKRGKRRGAKSRQSRRADPYRRLYQDVTDYLAYLKAELNWEKPRMEALAAAGDDEAEGEMTPEEWEKEIRDANSEEEERLREDAEDVLQWTEAEKYAVR